MKSSSSLFPVALMRAETVGDNLMEDTYLLKPNNSPDPSAQIALTRVGRAQLAPSGDRGVPVVLLHGSFSNSGFWLSSSGKGFASELVDAGFDPWLLEMRGHGDAPVNQQYKNNCVEVYGQYDLPAAQSFIQEQTNQNAYWIGHSLGGVTIATSLASGALDKNLIRGVVFFGTQVSRYPILLRMPFIRLAARLLLLRKKMIDGRKIGPEQEPVGIAREFVRWAGLFHGWKPKKGKSYWHDWRALSLPILGFGAKKDRGDPAKSCKKLVEATQGDKSFLLLSKKEGFLKDYGHVDMIISKEAAQEVWPKAISWLKSH